ncbi:MAG: hypothetical protein ACRDJH_06810 [Thermomicrobiales bacterium]
MSTPIHLPPCPTCGGTTTLARPDALARPEPHLRVRCERCGVTTELDTETTATVRQAAEAVVRGALDVLQQWARVVQSARLQVAAGTASPELVAALDHLDAYWADPAASEEVRRDAVDRVLQALGTPSRDLGAPGF